MPSAGPLDRPHLLRRSRSYCPGTGSQTPVGVVKKNLETPRSEFTSCADWKLVTERVAMPKVRPMVVRTPENTFSTERFFFCSRDFCSLVGVGMCGYLRQWKQGVAGEDQDAPSRTSRETTIHGLPHLTEHQSIGSIERLMAHRIAPSPNASPGSVKMKSKMSGHDLIGPRSRQWVSVRKKNGILPASTYVNWCTLKQKHPSYYA